MCLDTKGIALFTPAVLTSDLEKDLTPTLAAFFDTANMFNYEMNLYCVFIFLINIYGCIWMYYYLFETIKKVRSNEIELAE